MAPEMTEQEEVKTPKADIFSAGVARPSPFPPYTFWL